jgi:hypothetical protein
VVTLLVASLVSFLVDRQAEIIRGVVIRQQISKPDVGEIVSGNKSLPSESVKYVITVTS